MEGFSNLNDSTILVMLFCLGIFLREKGTFNIALSPVSLRCVHRAVLSPQLKGQQTAGPGRAAGISHFTARAAHSPQIYQQLSIAELTALPPALCAHHTQE